MKLSEFRNLNIKPNDNIGILDIYGNRYIFQFLDLEKEDQRKYWVKGIDHGTLFVKKIRLYTLQSIKILTYE
jgi:hypothetical protein